MSSANVCAIPYYAEFITYRGTVKKGSGVLMTSIRFIFLTVFVLVPLIALAQDPKQELNDQLWEAARKGDAAAVKALLDKGADVNARFRYGTTALFKAAERGNTEVVNVLLDRGADVKVKDTFYGATAMTWALQNEHTEIVRALLKKNPEDVEEVLMTGARGDNAGFVRVALDQGGLKAETLMFALAVTMSGKNKNAEIAELLKKAGAVSPPQLETATLQSYAGNFKNEQGREITITLRDGKLFATPGGQREFLLIVINETTLRPRDFDGLTFTMNIEEGKVTGLTLKQGTTTTLYKRVSNQ
jgi:Ankyrin repeats (3 copies)